jgi:hypothetical protein
MQMEINNTLFNMLRQKKNKADFLSTMIAVKYKLHQWSKSCLGHTNGTNTAKWNMCKKLASRCTFNEKNSWHPYQSRCQINEPDKQLT